MFKSRKQKLIVLAIAVLFCSCNKPAQNIPPKPAFKGLIVKSWAIVEPYMGSDTMYFEVLDTITNPEYSYTGFKFWGNGNIRYYEYTHDSGGCGVGAIEYYYGKWQITDSIVQLNMTKKIWGDSAYKFIAYYKILKLADSSLVLKWDSARSKIVSK